MKRVHIIGGKNHGKTTLVVELVRELTAQGMRIGTIKHTHHHHELDAPGKDSHRHRDAGSEVVGICARSMNAVFWPPDSDRSLQNDDERYAKFVPMFEQCDLVLVEGDSKADAPKLEVWRSEIGSVPLAALDLSISAVITNAPQLEHVKQPLWPRSNVSLIARNILSLDHSVRAVQRVSSEPTSHD